MDTAALAGEHLRTFMTHAPLAPRAPSPERLARDDARRLATHRVAFLGHAVAWSTVGLFLFVVAGAKVALIVALAWGIGLACHGFFAVLGPVLRRRWTDDEVARRLASNVV